MTRENFGFGDNVEKFTDLALVEFVGVGGVVTADDDFGEMGSWVDGCPLRRTRPWSTVPFFISPSRSAKMAQE